MTDVERDAYARGWDDAVARKPAAMPDSIVYMLGHGAGTYAMTQTNAWMIACPSAGSRDNIPWRTFVVPAAGGPL